MDSLFLIAKKTFNAKFECLASNGRVIVNKLEFVVNFLLDHSTEESISFCAIQSEVGSKIFNEQGAEADLKSSYLLKKGKLYADSSAVLQ